MPWDCGFLCLLSEKRRYTEILWRKQLLITADERKAKRRFQSLMKGFDTEDLDVLRKAITSNGQDIMHCAPGPPMDLVEDEEMELLPGCTTVATTMPTTIGINASRITRTSSVRYSNSSRHNSHSTTFNRTNNNSINARHPSNAAYITILNSRDENSNPLAGGLDQNDNTGGGRYGEIDQVFEDSGLIPQIDRPMSMPYLCCKMWRWKELQVDAALHRLEPLPWCRFGRVTINQATVSCCNPYHYALYLYNPENASNSEDQSLTGIMANGGGPIPENSLTNDTGFGDEITGNSHQPRDYYSTGIGSDDLPPASSPPPIPNNIPLINHISPSPPPIHAHAIAWGKLARWQKRERIGEVVSLVGKFAALGKLAGTVYDGQDIKHEWDIENNVSFALMKRVESEFYEDVWLYNSGDKPLFICLSQSHKSENIRRLSPGYCIRVYRIPTDNESPRYTTPRQNSFDPANSMSILTISVGRGWGINYQRLFVTDMPCRYEIIFT